jgi:predicted GNAT family N-acyltransferase
MRIERASFEADYAAIRHVRITVFVEEQHVPEEIELDERDPLCLHVVAYDQGGAPIGTGRLDVAYGGKIGRVAVLAHARGGGVGSALMSRLHELAASAGLRAVWCNAQLSAAVFYERLGYRAGGERFFEAGIEHVRMDREL